MRNWTEKKDLAHYFTVHGSFGRVEGEAVITRNGNTQTVSGTASGCYLETTITKDESGVFVRNGKIRNDTDTEMQICSALYRYCFNGGDYEAYTQYNNWQLESIGGWQRIVTGVSTHVETPRNCSGATPLLAVYNLQNGHGMAFDLLPDGAWVLNAMREGNDLNVTAGNSLLKSARTLLPGEELKLPTVLCYPFTNKLDLDAWKLHRYAHRNIPQRTMPVIYNTWMFRFDNICYEDLSKQIPKAADLGCEYFVIDAGWFGDGDARWFELRGDWKENMTACLCGSMKTIADEVRAHGMKFGFWLETESAGPKAEIVREHPDWFLCDHGVYFLDFTNREAVDAMFEKVCSLVDRYGAEFLKFDYNQDLAEDKTMTSLCAYKEGYHAYVDRIRARYPALYLECCGSGGMRTDLANCLHFDTYWLSDNQSPYEGMRIVKETLKRLPPQRIERWACITSYAATQPFADDKILACNDCSWDRVVSVHDSYLKAFLTGGPIGLSCDLTELSEKTYGLLKQWIAEFKEEREYYAQTEVRILCDTETVLLLQYGDPELTDVRVQVISGNLRQNLITVYPVLDENAYYVCDDGSEGTGRSYMENGVVAGFAGRDAMRDLRFRKK